MRNLFIFYLLILMYNPLSAQPSKTFTNPLLKDGADPWTIFRDGYYYYIHTEREKLSIRKTKDLAELSTAQVKTIWMPPSTGPNSALIWAPELHFLDGKWYVYYTATDKNNSSDLNRFVFVLENSSSDPMKGEWVDKGRLNTKYSGLDGSVFEHGGKRYFLYSGYVGPQSNLFICGMSNPWTLTEEQVQIASPTKYWEKFGNREILEGPQFLQGKKGNLLIVYSASACWADEYALGMLEADGNSNLMDAGSWKKHEHPVFKQSPANGVYAPGHNSFFKSPDGTEDWILYHATSAPNQQCRNRSPRMQRFTWKSDGTPDFGEPAKAGVLIPAPSDSK